MTRGSPPHRHGPAGRVPLTGGHPVRRRDARLDSRCGTARFPCPPPSQLEAFFAFWRHPSSSPAWAWPRAAARSRLRPSWRPAPDDIGAAAQAVAGATTCDASEVDPGTEANARSPSADPSVRRRRRMKTNTRNRPPSVVTISASTGAGGPPPSRPGSPGAADAAGSAVVALPAVRSADHGRDRSLAGRWGRGDGRRAWRGGRLGGRGRRRSLDRFGRGLGGRLGNGFGGGFGGWFRRRLGGRFGAVWAWELRSASALGAAVALGVGTGVGLGVGTGVGLGVGTGVGVGTTGSPSRTRVRRPCRRSLPWNCGPGTRRRSCRAASWSSGSRRFRSRIRSSGTTCRCSEDEPTMEPDPGCP